MVTQGLVKELFEYTADGVLLRRTCRNHNAKEGVITRRPDRLGYLMVGINSKHYFVHRLVWMYHHGYFPEHGLDHINRVVTDNRIENLREVSQSCNVKNARQRSDNRSGVRGVSWMSRDSLWVSQIKGPGKNTYLGRYEDFDEAVCARLAAEQCLDWENCDSQSPAYQYVVKLLSGVRQGNAKQTI